MMNNYIQGRVSQTNENCGRYFGKELYNFQQDANENKTFNQLTVNYLLRYNYENNQSFNIPLTQRQDLADPLTGVFQTKKGTQQPNSGFCQTLQTKLINLQRGPLLQRCEEKENSQRKLSKLQTEISAMETEDTSNQEYAKQINFQFQGMNAEYEYEQQQEQQQQQQQFDEYTFDLSVANDTLYVTPYIQDIFKYLNQQELKYIHERSYMTPQNQPDINSKMRAILIDWLVDVHLKFKLRDETLYVTINLIDRYLSIQSTSRQQLQLVGVSALFMACKYEEIYPPDLKDFVYITDNAYTKAEVLDMEGKILLALQFNITQPSMYCFLQRYGKVAGLDKKNLFLAQYLLELALIDMKFITYKPSQMVSSVVYLVHKIRKVNDPWGAEMQHISEYQEQELRPCAKELCLLLQSAEKNSLQAVRKKFSTAKFMEVSRIRVERTNK